MEQVIFNILLTEMPRAAGNQIASWNFLLFSVCFLINVFVLSKRRPLVLSMLDNLFHRKERKSIFFVQGSYDLFAKLLLVIQTILLVGMLFFCFYKIIYPRSLDDSMVGFFTLVGKGAAFFALFLLYKYLTYNLIGFVFFSKERTQLWNNSFTSVVCLSGIFLFIPAMLFFYIETLSVFSFYFILFYLVFIVLFVFYLIYRVFFRDKVPLLYFILYLCAQEIAPVFIIYKGIVCFL